MAKISFVKAISPVTVKKNDNLMKSLTSSGIPVGSSCGGEGVCTKCLIRIVDGRDNLTPPNSLEKSLKEKFRFAADRRVSCQTEILGDVTVDTDYW